MAKPEFAFEGAVVAATDPFEVRLMALQGELAAAGLTDSAQVAGLFYEEGRLVTAPESQILRAKLMTGVAAACADRARLRQAGLDVDEVLADTICLAAFSLRRLRVANDRSVHDGMFKPEQLPERVREEVHELEFGLAKRPATVLARLYLQDKTLPQGFIAREQAAGLLRRVEEVGKTNPALKPLLAELSKGLCAQLQPAPVKAAPFMGDKPLPLRHCAWETGRNCGASIDP